MLEPLWYGPVAGGGIVLSLYAKPLAYTSDSGNWRQCYWWGWGVLGCLMCLTLLRKRQATQSWFSWYPCTDPKWVSTVFSYFLRSNFLFFDVFLDFLFPDPNFSSCCIVFRFIWLGESWSFKLLNCHPCISAIVVRMANIFGQFFGGLGELITLAAVSATILHVTFQLITFPFKFRLSDARFLEPVVFLVVILLALVAWQRCGFVLVVINLKCWNGALWRGNQAS